MFLEVLYFFYPFVMNIQRSMLENPLTQQETTDIVRGQKIGRNISCTTITGGILMKFVKNTKMETDSLSSGVISLTFNRNYKDTVFRMLFSDKERLLELYNAVSGRNYDNQDDLQIVTLDNAVYMGMKNDLAFLLDTGIYLYEHQSTFNPNIPLRDLIYIASEYNKLIETKSLYSSVVQKIPTPNFIMFYNGERDIEDRSEYRLSDAFETKVDNPSLELRVMVLNVNYGRNSALMEQCRTLRDYAQYVAIVRQYKEELGSLDEAVRAAVDRCISEGILSDFLKKNRAEVEMTSILEYNQEEEEKKLRTAERQVGKASELYRIVNNFMAINNVTVEKACEMMGISSEEYCEAEKVFNEDNR